MDPDVTLEWLRNELKPELLDMKGEAAIEIDGVVQMFQALDEWLVKGGFLPKAWRETRDTARIGRHWTKVDGIRRLTCAQRDRLWTLCGSYAVPFDERHYPVDKTGWCEGWIGGEPGTLYVGVSPEGESHS